MTSPVTFTPTEEELLAAQEWRTETPGTEGWTRTVRPSDPDKYFVVSADCHAIEPKGWGADYLDRSKELPSAYFRRQGYATFGEDAPGLALAEEFDLVDNFMWASDYPHPEGSWPHSAEAVERQMGGLRDESRAKILGLNAARLFGLSVPNGKGPA